MKAKCVFYNGFLFFCLWLLILSYNALGANKLPPHRRKGLDRNGHGKDFPRGISREAHEWFIRERGNIKSVREFGPKMPKPDKSETTERQTEGNWRSRYLSLKVETRESVARRALLEGRLKEMTQQLQQLQDRRDHEIPKSGRQSFAEWNREMNQNLTRSSFVIEIRKSEKPIVDPSQNPKRNGRDRSQDFVVKNGGKSVSPAVEISKILNMSKEDQTVLADFIDFYGFNRVFKILTDDIKHNIGTIIVKDLQTIVWFIESHMMWDTLELSEYTTKKERRAKARDDMIYNARTDLILEDLKGIMVLAITHPRNNEVMDILYEIYGMSAGKDISLSAKAREIWEVTGFPPAVVDILSASVVVGTMPEKPSSFIMPALDPFLEDTFPQYVRLTVIEVMGAYPQIRNSLFRLAFFLKFGKFSYINRLYIDPYIKGLFYHIERLKRTSDIELHLDEINALIDMMLQRSPSQDMAILLTYL